MQDEVMVNCYSIDNKDYMLVKEVNLDNKKYVYLVNLEDSEDAMVRIIEEDTLIPVNTQEEVYQVMQEVIK